MTIRMLSATLALAAVWPIATASAQQNPFLGRWNLTGTGPDSGNIYWLEVTDDGGKLTGKFLNRGGSPVPLSVVKVENGELVFQMAPGRNNRPAPEFRAQMQG